MEQKGPKCSPNPWSQRMGNLIRESNRLPGLKWAGEISPLLSCSSSPGGPLMLASLVLPLASFLCPPRPMWPGGMGALEGRGQAWELSKLSGPECVGQTPSTPLPFLSEGPSHLPLLMFPASLLCPGVGRCRVSISPQLGHLPATGGGP